LPDDSGESVPHRHDEHGRPVPGPDRLCTTPALLFRAVHAGRRWQGGGLRNLARRERRYRRGREGTAPATLHQPERGDPGTPAYRRPAGWPQLLLATRYPDAGCFRARLASRGPATAGGIPPSPPEP